MDGVQRLGPRCYYIVVSIVYRPQPTPPLPGTSSPLTYIVHFDPIATLFTHENGRSSQVITKNDHRLISFFLYSVIL